MKENKRGSKKKHNNKSTPDNKKATVSPSSHPSSNTSLSCTTIDASTIKGMDDMGHFYNSHQELLDYQETYRKECYQANEQFWQTGGYGGTTDEEAMIGDSDGIQDCVLGLDFLDRLQLDATTTTTTTANNSTAIDVGAGVGRVTKLILLKRYQQVHLIEGNTSLSEYSRVYLGRKRATRCHFTNCALQNLTETTLASEQPVDLIWVQWTLQYMLDIDVISCLQTLAKLLASSNPNNNGIMVVKENRPFGNAREDRFQMDTHLGSNQRYDITRSDAHHRLLFQRAGLKIQHMEKGVETHTYALCRDG